MNKFVLTVAASVAALLIVDAIKSNLEKMT